MKLALFTILALCIIAVCESAEEEYDYEEEIVAPVTPAPAKPTGGRLGGLLSSRGRVNVAGVGKKRPSSIQSTTAKSVEQAPEEVEAEDEGAFDDSEEREAATTTTEAAKKLQNKGVRPFRSNEDLLAALKRRRAQTGSNSHPRETATTQSAAEHTTAKSKAASSRGKASTGGETRASGRGRFGGRGSKTAQEEVEETQREEVQVRPKTSSYRRG